MDFDGALFNVNATVSIAKPQNYSGKSVRDIIDRTISNKVRYDVRTHHYAVVFQVV